MKSMLHEAATVQKAVEQAWQDAGKPSEFTIKILDAGKKGLLWLSRRPAIISIAYDPKLATEASVHSKKSNQKSYKNNERNNRNPSKNRDRNAKSTTPNNSNRTRRNNVDDKNRSRDNRDNTKNTNRPAPKQANSQPLGWSPEAIDEVKKNLENIVKILNISTPFSVRTEKKTLYLTFDERIHHDEQKLLFISLSYLLMQFLKKAFKKKFNGYQLMLTTKAALNNNESKQDSSSTQ